MCNYVHVGMALMTSFEPELTCYDNVFIPRMYDRRHDIRCGDM